jgi:hypothetical protein
MVFSLLTGGRTSVRSRRVRGLSYGPRRPLSVHAPIGADGEAPVVVILPSAVRDFWRRGDSVAVGLALASRGFVALAPGSDPAAPLDQRLEDAALACAWAEHHAADHGGDPRRMFVLGHADGACAAAMLALDPRWLQAAGAKGVLRGVVGVSGLYDLEPLEAHAGAEAPPMLLIAGSEGPSGCSTGRLARARRSVGGPVAEIRYPGLDAASGLHGLASALGLSRTPLEDVERFIRLCSLETVA